MAVIPNSCRECNQHDCVNHQFEWFMKNNPNVNSANSVSPNCPLLKEVSQEPILDKIRVEIKQLRLHKAQFITNDNKVCIDSQAVIDIIDKYKADDKSQESEEQE